MTAQCPICRTSVDVDLAGAGPEGVRASCSLCEEVFTVKPPAAEPPPSSGTRGNTDAGSGSGSTSGSGSASRRLLQEDLGEGAAPRVLVAHDSHSFGDLARVLLEEEGFDVEVVHDGIAAERRLLDDPPAVVILEAGLPRKFGFQLCADMRARPEPPSSKFLLVASIFDRRRLSRSAALATAPDDFVEPRNIEIELVPKVRKLLRGRAEGTGSRSVAFAARSVEVPEEEAPDLSVPARATAGTSSARAADPVGPAADEPSRASEDGIDFGELFEESSKTSGTGSSGLPQREPSMTPAPPDAPPITDVDSFLSSAPGKDPTKDPARPKTGAERIPEGVDDDEREIWEKVLADEDKSAEDDELLRSLMEMAQSDKSISTELGSEDGVAIGGSAEAAPVTVASPANASADVSEEDLLGGIFEDGSPQGDADATPPPRDREREAADGGDLLRLSELGNDGFEDADRAPAAGPLDMPSHGPVPETWKADDAEKALSQETDEEALDAILRGAGAIEGEKDGDGDADADAPRPSESSRAKQPVRSPDDDVLSASDLENDGFELGGAFEGGAPDADEGDAPADADTLMQDGFSEFPTEAVERPGNGFDDLGTGAIPGGANDDPTVLRGPTESSFDRPRTASRETEQLPRDLDGLDDGPDEFGPATSASPPPVTPKTDEELDRLVTGSDLAGEEDDLEKSLAEFRLKDDEADSLPVEPPAAQRSQSVSEPAEDGPEEPPGGFDRDEEHKKARRLAKLIVGDIVLYNADRISEAVKSGAFFDTMKGDIKDGREFYEEKVPEFVRKERDYIQEVLEEVLQNKKKELGLS